MGADLGPDPQGYTALRVLGSPHSRRLWVIVPGRTSSSAHGFGGPWGPVDARPMLPQSLGKPAFASFKVISDEAALKNKNQFCIYLFGYVGS